MDAQTPQAPETIINLKDNNDAHKLPTVAEIQGWLFSYLADLLEVDPDEIDETIPFDAYNLDSSAAIELTGDLEDWLGRKLSPILLYDYPTIGTLAQHLSQEDELKN